MHDFEEGEHTNAAIVKYNDVNLWATILQTTSLRRNNETHKLVDS
jgi:hypothetical protein